MGYPVISRDSHDFPLTPQEAVQKLKTPGAPFPTKSGMPLDLSEVVIECPRVRLRPLRSEDANDLFKEFTREITRYLIHQPTGRIEDNLAFIQGSIAGRATGRDLAFLIADRASGEFLECGGLHSQARSVEPHLGIWIKKSAHGKGYGREAIAGVVQWAFGTFEIQALRYDFDRANTASQKVVESLGGICVGEEATPQTDGGMLDTLIYHIKRPKG